MCRETIRGTCLEAGSSRVWDGLFFLTCVRPGPLRRSTASSQWLQPGAVRSRSRSRRSARPPCWAATALRQVDLAEDVAGELTPMAGTTVRGRRRSNVAAERRVRQGLGYVPQEHAIFAKPDGVRREPCCWVVSAVADRSGIDYVLDFFPKLAQRLTAGLPAPCRAAMRRYAGDRPRRAGRPAPDARRGRPKASGSR